MKIKIFEHGNQDHHPPGKEPKRKFCLLPCKAVDAKLNLGEYIVWFEWVEWSDIYNAWIINPSSDAK